MISIECGSETAIGCEGASAYSHGKRQTVIFFVVVCFSQHTDDPGIPLLLQSGMAVGRDEQIEAASGGEAAILHTNKDNYFWRKESEWVTATARWQVHKRAQDHRAVQLSLLRTRGGRVNKKTSKTEQRTSFKQSRAFSASARFSNST